MDKKGEWAGTETEHQIVSIDLSSPGVPKERWRRVIPARRGFLVAQDVALAPDASAYAYVEPMPAALNTVRVVVNWMTRARREVVLEAPDYWFLAPIIFSTHADFLAYRTVSGFALFDLRGPQPTLYKQEFSFDQDRYRCLLAVLNSGYVVLDDAHAPRFGIYAPQERLPRVAVMPHDGGDYCDRAEAQPDDRLLTFPDDRGLQRLDLRIPRQPSVEVTWQLPAGVYPYTSAGSLLIASAGTDGRWLRVFRLDQTEPTIVDWSALDQAHTRAMDEYRIAVKRSGAATFGAASFAVRSLEQAGVLLALHAPLNGLSPKRAAALFNDYGFLAAKIHPQSPEAESALRRALALDPERALAALNLADVLRQRLSPFSDSSQEPASTAEIVSLYRKYLALGGRSTPEIEEFLTSSESKPADICEAVASYANGGKLQELVTQSATNVEVSGHRYDIVFDTEGTAHVPVMHAFDAVTGSPVELDVKTPWGDSLWGGDQLGLLRYRDTVQIIDYRDLRHPVKTAPISGAGSSCRFNPQTTETVGKRATEPKLCRILTEPTDLANPAENFPANAATEPVELTQPAPITMGPIRPRFWETAADGMGKVDFANDGQAVNVAKLSLSSGAGAGCEEEFYDVLSADGQALGTGPKHDLLMQLQQINPHARYPVPCGDATRFFKYAGQVYFETKPAVWPPQDSWDEYHRVTAAKGGKVVEVCDFQFEDRVVTDD
ncbi:MAG: hypothetical protein WBE92_05695 [Steroidobacteraceae bacterium]